MYMTTIDNRPQLVSRLRGHIVEVPEEARAASGIVINGRRIKTLMFTTDIAIIRNCDADAVLAVYPFTPQQTISDAIIQSASIPVFCGVGGVLFLLGAALLVRYWRKSAANSRRAREARATQKAQAARPSYDPEIR